MKELKTIIKQELRGNESIWITTDKKLNSSLKDWWKFDEYKLSEIIGAFTGKEKVKKYWHEEGLFIILK